MWLIFICNGLLAIPEKKCNQVRWGGGRGRWGHTFFEKTVEFLGLSFYPWKFENKWSFNPRKIPQNCVTPLGTKRVKNQDFLHHPWKFQFFFNWPLEFQTLYFPQPSPLFGVFSGNSSIATAILKLWYKIVIWLFRWS